MNQIFNSSYLSTSSGRYQLRGLRLANTSLFFFFIYVCRMINAIRVFCKNSTLLRSTYTVLEVVTHLPHLHKNQLLPESRLRLFSAEGFKLLQGVKNIRFSRSLLFQSSSYTTTGRNLQDLLYWSATNHTPTLLHLPLLLSLSSSPICLLFNIRIPFLLLSLPLHHLYQL